MVLTPYCHHHLKYEESIILWKTDLASYMLLKFSFVHSVQD